MNYDQSRFGVSEVSGKTAILMEEEEEVIDELANKNSDLLLHETRKSGKIFLILAFCLTFIIMIPYTVRFRNGELDPMVSRLSQDCDSTWQNGFFNICLFLTCLLGMSVVTLRFMYVSNMIDEVVPKMRLINKYGLWCGYICFSGFLLIASVPLDYKLENDLQPHISCSSVGGFIIFFFGALYISFQTSITFFFASENKRVLFARISIFLAASVTFASYCVIVNTITKYNYEKTVFPLDSAMISSMEGGSVSLYKKLHVLGAICEWLTSVLFALYFLTFARECEQIWCVVTFIQHKHEKHGLDSSETAV